VFTSKGYITGFHLVSEHSAVQLKLNAIQVIILNAFIINWLADKLQKFDENNPLNQLYYFNIYHWAKYFNVSKKYLKYNIIALTKLITCLDGIKVQIMFRNVKQRGMYIGMHLSVIHQLVDTELYNIQCDYHKKPELKCSIRDEDKKNWIENERMEKSVGNNQLVLATQKICNGEKDMKPLFENDISYNSEKRNHSEWAEGIVKKLCEMASESNAQLFKNGKSFNVFNHLENGEFRKRRDGVDSACEIIDDLFSGQFFRVYKKHELFGTINKDHLQLKKTDAVIEKIMFLSKTKNKAGIEKFIFRCARNYFDALMPGKETYQDIKASFPVSVKSFLLHRNRDGTFVANFLMYYFATLTEKDMEINQAKSRVKKSVPESVFNDLLNYETYVLENQIQSYWLNVNKLVKEIKSIIKNEETSYSMESCFDIVFKKVNDISAHHKKVLPGYFDPEQKTASDAIIEIRDK